MRLVARTIASLFVLVLTLVSAITAGGQPSGTMTWGVHVTLATRWLDTSETEAEITPFMILYALHDALVKPMPGNLNSPSLAESWTVSKDGGIWEFVLRKGPRFHNGDPVTADDVKFSFERYRGAAATLFICKRTGDRAHAVPAVHVDGRSDRGLPLGGRDQDARANHGARRAAIGLA
jgi:ABC-type transport system substrate-binding protein